MSLRYRMRLAWIRWRVRLSALAVLGPLLLVAYSLKIWGEPVWKSNWLRIPTFIFATLVAFINFVEAWRDKRHEEVTQKQTYLSTELRTAYLEAMGGLADSAWRQVSLFILLGSEGRKRAKLNYEQCHRLHEDLHRPLYVQKAFTFQPEERLYYTYAVALCWNHEAGAFMADAAQLSQDLSRNMATEGIQQLVEKRRSFRRREAQRRDDRERYWDTLTDVLRYRFQYWKYEFIETGQLPLLSYSVAPIRDKSSAVMGCVVIQLPVDERVSDSLYAVAIELANGISAHFFP
jgi:hypothetical protein